MARSHHPIWEYITVQVTFWSRGKQKTNIYQEFYNSTFPVQRINVTLSKGKSFRQRSFQGAVLVFADCPDALQVATSTILSTNLSLLLSTAANRKSIPLVTGALNIEKNTKNQRVKFSASTTPSKTTYVMSFNASSPRPAPLCAALLQWRFEKDIKTKKPKSNHFYVGDVLVVKRMGGNFRPASNLECHKDYQLDVKVEEIQRLLPAPTYEMIVSLLDRDISKEHKWAMKVTSSRKLHVSLRPANLPSDFELRLKARRHLCRLPASLSSQKSNLMLGGCSDGSSSAGLALGCRVRQGCRDGYLPQTSTQSKLVACTSRGLRESNAPADEPAEDLVCKAGCFVYNAESHSFGMQVWRSSNGTLLSPNYPDIFRILPKCWYTIVSIAPRRIYLNFTNFNYSLFDLQLIDGANKPAPINVTTNLIAKGHHIYTSKWPQLTIKVVQFSGKSNSATGGDRFHLTYVTKVDACVPKIPSSSRLASGKLTILSANKTIVSYSCRKDTAFSALFWKNPKSPQQFQQDAHFRQRQDGGSICRVDQVD